MTTSTGYFDHSTDAAAYAAAEQLKLERENFVRSWRNELDPFKIKELDFYFTVEINDGTDNNGEIIWSLATRTSDSRAALDYCTLFCGGRNVRFSHVKSYQLGNFSGEIVGHRLIDVPVYR